MTKKIYSLLLSPLYFQRTPPEFFSNRAGSLYGPLYITLWQSSSENECFPPWEAGVYLHLRVEFSFQVFNFLSFILSLSFPPFLSFSFTSFFMSMSIFLHSNYVPFIQFYIPFLFIHLVIFYYATQQYSLYFHTVFMHFLFYHSIHHSFIYNFTPPRLLLALFPPLHWNSKSTLQYA